MKYFKRNLKQFITSMFLLTANGMDEINTWLQEANERFRSISHDDFVATWNYDSNINKDTGRKVTHLNNNIQSLILVLGSTNVDSLYPLNTE